MTDIETRLAAIEDRIAIGELRARYCWYMTRGLKDEVVALFTEDGVFQSLRRAGASGPEPKGKAALQAYFANAKPAGRVPVVMNEVTHIEGDRAEGTCVMQSLGDDAFCGHYIDRFRKVNGQWLFAARHFYPYWPTYMPHAARRHP